MEVFFQQVQSEFYANHPQGDIAPKNPAIETSWLRV
jgi:hypothetical protein